VSSISQNISLGSLGEIGSKCCEVDAKRIVLVSDRTVVGLHGEAVRKSLGENATPLGPPLVRGEAEPPFSPPLGRGETETDNKSPQRGSLKPEILRCAQNDDEFIIEPGEASKSIGTAAAMYQFLAARHVERDAMILALGGGVVSDLAGFVAATWMRGIRWAICPTTLEAQIDAAIGGKTAINIPGGKNLVGAFHDPEFVLIDPAVLATLPDRDFRAGLAESVKHALITSEELFTWHETHCESILARDSSILEELIRRNIEIKSEIVAGDPHETAKFDVQGREEPVPDRRGSDKTIPPVACAPGSDGSRELKFAARSRMVLNFGHTIGHAIEECSGYSLRHGECVALGMIAACRLSCMLGLVDSGLPERVRTLLQRFGLPTTLAEPIPIDDIISLIRKDKKNRSDGLRFVLLESVGRPRIQFNISEAQIIEAYNSLAV